MKIEPSEAKARSDGRDKPSATGVSVNPTCSAVMTSLEDTETLDADTPPAMTRKAPERALSSVTEPSTTNDASSSVCAPVLNVGSMTLQSNAVPLAAVTQLTPVSVVRLPST
jgi:hypothetical protein